MNYKETYASWLASDTIDEATKAELRSIADNEEEIKFRFIGLLAFGTGGLRGTMMAGTNAMNPYTVAHATQGFANLILREGAADRGVVVGRDSRNNSELFAKITAEVLAANGIKVYFLDALRPTPVLSFAIRELGCIAGVNITASHNPSEYNGYKAYWEDGAQIAPEQANVVSAERAKFDVLDMSGIMDFDEGVKCGLITVLDEKFDEKYLDAVISTAVNTNAVKEVADELKVVYTPIHGAGYKLVPEVFKSQSRSR